MHHGIASRQGISRYPLHSIFFSLPFCATGTRVIDVLELLAPGESREQILEYYPYLEDEDIAASLLYAARRMNHTTAAA